MTPIETAAKAISVPMLVSAMSAAVIPAMTKGTVIAGPAPGTAVVAAAKIPIPTVAPTPNMVSWNRPLLRASTPPIRRPPDWR